MTPPGETPAEGAEDSISAVLRIGVAASLLLIASGSLLSFLQDGGYRPGPAETSRLAGPAGSFPRTAAWLGAGLIHFNGQAVIVAGLLVLIATPVLRVGVSMVAFARERDRVYVAVTATVLLLLLISFALGKSG